MSEKNFYTIKEVQEILGVCQNTAYKLAHTKGFPIMRINRKILVPKDKFEYWVQRNLGKTIKV